MESTAQPAGVTHNAYINKKSNWIFKQNTKEVLVIWISYSEL